MEKRQSKKRKITIKVIEKEIRYDTIIEIFTKKFIENQGK